VEQVGRGKAASGLQNNNLKRDDEVRYPNLVSIHCQVVIISLYLLEIRVFVDELGVWCEGLVVSQSQNQRYALISSVWDWSCLNLESGDWI